MLLYRLLMENSSQERPMQPHIVRPVQLTPRWVFFLDFCYVWVFYLICVDNQLDGSNWEDETTHYKGSKSLFDVAVLSMVRTLLLIYILKRVKQGRSNMIVIVCVLLQLLMIGKCMVYDFRDVTLSSLFLLGYVQIIGLIEFFSVVLPPDSNRQGSLHPERGNDTQPLLYDLESGSRTGTNRSGEKTISSRPHKTTRNEYSEIIEKTTKRLKDACKSDGTWEQPDTADDVQIYKRQDGPLTSSKGVGLLPVSPRIASLLVRNIDKRIKWDEMFQEGDLVELVDKATRIIHLRFKAVWPTVARDLCLIDHVREEEDGSFVVVSVSIRHAQVPPNPNFVRGDLQCGGWIFAPIAGKPNATKATYILQVDPCGSIPSFVINMIATKQPLCIAALRRLIENDPHILSHIEQEETDIELGASPKTFARTSKYPKDFTPLADEFANARSRPRYAETSRIAFTRLYNAAMGAEAEGWRNIGEIDGVRLSKQRSSITGVTSFKGVAVIPAHPKDVYELVVNLSRRRDWDVMYKEGAVAETMNSNHRILYLSFHPQVMTWPRDFCVLESRRVNPETNSYHIAIMSTLHPSVPEFGGFVRGEIIFGGYIIEPFGSVSYTKIIYCASIDPKGWVPLSIVNSVSSKQPMVITSIRDLLSVQQNAYQPPTFNLQMDEEQTSPQLGRPQIIPGQGANSMENGIELMSSVDEKSSFSSRTRPKPNSIESYIEKMQRLIERVKVESIGGQDLGWVFHSRQQEVDISMKMIQDQLATRGITVFDYPINVVHWYLQQYDRRGEWDSMFLSVNHIEQVIPIAAIVHHKFKALFPTSSRDFCSIVCRIVEPNGTHILASTAVDHPSVPPDPAFVRGEIVTSGFVLKAISSSQTQVTYILHIDLKGIIPPFMTNTIAVKQPLCLASIRMAMNKYRNQLQSDFVPPPDCYRDLSSFLPKFDESESNIDQDPTILTPETHSNGYAVLE